MKIELLYFDGCPNWRQAETLVRKALNKLHLQAEIKLIKVTGNHDAPAKRFVGSPAIRIKGNDIEINEDDTTAYSMRGRRSRSGPDMLWFPPEELILTALKNSMERA